MIFKGDGVDAVSAGGSDCYGEGWSLGDLGSMIPGDFACMNPPANPTGRGDFANGGGGNRAKGDRDKLIHDLCDRIRANGGDRVTFNGGRDSVSFDNNGLLNGASMRLNSGDKTTLNVPGYSVTLAPYTVANISWMNAPSGDRQVSVWTSRPVDISAGFGKSAAISVVSFDGSFHAEGLFSGYVENMLNRDVKSVIFATDFANKLYNSKIPCETVISAITFF
jgi:hypothetical protein